MFRWAILFLLNFSIFLPYFANSSSIKLDLKNAYSQLEPELYLEIKRVAQEFMRVYPPDKYYYFGLGRSPHAILAYIDALQLGQVRYVPISNAKWHFQNSKYEILHSPERVQRGMEHFSKFLPSDKALNGRKLLVVDFCDLGSGIQVGMFYITEIFFAQGRDLKQISAVGLHLPNTLSKSYWRTQEKIERIWIQVQKFNTVKKNSQGEALSSRPSLYSAMMYGDPEDWLETFSPVGYYNFETMIKDDSYSERRAEYQILLQWIREQDSCNLYLT